MSGSNSRSRRQIALKPFGVVRRVVIRAPARALRAALGRVRNCARERRVGRGAHVTAPFQPEDVAAARANASSGRSAVRQPTMPHPAQPQLRPGLGRCRWSGSRRRRRHAAPRRTASSMRGGNACDTRPATRSQRSSSQLHRYDLNATKEHRVRQRRGAARWRQRRALATSSGKVALCRVTLPRVSSL
jgi:hypothetical protein